MSSTRPKVDHAYSRSESACHLRETAELDAVLRPLVETMAPDLITLKDVGADTAALWWRLRETTRRLGTIPFGECAGQWLAIEAPRLQDSTADFYRYLLRRHVLPRFGMVRSGG